MGPAILVYALGREVRCHRVSERRGLASTTSGYAEEPPSVGRGRLPDRAALLLLALLRSHRPRRKAEVSGRRIEPPESAAMAHSGILDGVQARIPFRHEPATSTVTTGWLLLVPRSHQSGRRSQKVRTIPPLPLLSIGDHAAGSRIRVRAAAPTGTAYSGFAACACPRRTRRPLCDGPRSFATSANRPDGADHVAGRGPSRHIRRGRDVSADHVPQRTSAVESRQPGLFSRAALMRHRLIWRPMFRFAGASRAAAAVRPVGDRRGPFMAADAALPPSL
jgi:hypothetical protein